LLACLLPCLLPSFLPSLPQVIPQVVPSDQRASVASLLRCEVATSQPCFVAKSRRTSLASLLRRSRIFVSSEGSVGRGWWRVGWGIRA
jgi:hypothetical protein